MVVALLKDQLCLTLFYLKGGLTLAHPYYNVCCSNIGRGVCITTTYGKVYRGVICQVTPTHVHIAPIGRRISEDTTKNLSSVVTTAKGTKQKEEVTEIQFGFGGFGGFGTGIALATIAALAFL
jgi:hypothetical protein